MIRFLRQHSCLYDLQSKVYTLCAGCMHVTQLEPLSGK